MGCCASKNVSHPSLQGAHASAEMPYHKFQSQMEPLESPRFTHRSKSSKRPLEGAQDMGGSGIYSSKTNPFLAKPKQEEPEGPQYSLGQLIGKGAFGEVYQAMDQASGQIIAVKRVLVKKTKSVVRDIRSLKNEIDTLRTLSHEHIVQYLGFEVDLQRHSVDILMEFVPRSLKYVLQRFGALNEQLVKMYSLQILQGLCYLHSVGILHRDLKCANILIDNDGTCKLSDFGASLKLNNTSENPTELTGSPFWMAPEVIRQQPYAYPADIWSFACVVLELLSGKPPWSSFDYQIPFLLAKIASETGPPPYPDNISAQCREFLDLCFQRDVEQRPNCRRLLKHPFMEDAQRLLDESMQDPGTGGSAELLEMIQHHTPPIYRLNSKPMPPSGPTIRNKLPEQIEDYLLQEKQAQGDPLNKPLTEGERNQLLRRSEEREAMDKKFANNPSLLHDMLAQPPGDNDSGQGRGMAGLPFVGGGGPAGALGAGLGAGVQATASREVSTVWGLPPHEEKVIETALAAEMRASEAAKEEEKRKKNEEMRLMYEQELQAFLGNQKKERRDEHRESSSVRQYPMTHV